MTLLLLGVLSVLGLQVLPQPFPREGITKAFENERVVVWHGILGTKGRPTVMHQHRLDLVGVMLDQGQTKVTLQDGSTREGQPFESGHVVFQPSGVAHIEEVLVDGTRAVGIEIKNEEASAHVTHMSDTPKAFPRAGARLLVENDRVAIWDFQWIPGQIVATHFHDRDAVVVPLETGEVRYTSPNGQSRTDRLVFGEATFMHVGESHGEEAVDGSPRAIIVELK